MGLKSVKVHFTDKYLLIKDEFEGVVDVRGCSGEVDQGVKRKTSADHDQRGCSLSE
jgi:hypothetical protein